MEPVVGKKKIEKLAVGGLAGTGKSTIAKFVAKLLGYKFVSVGKYFHEIAVREKVDPSVLESMALSDHRYDREVDKRVASRDRRAKKSYVIEGRIAVWNVKDPTLKILFVCNDPERWKRIADREKISYEKARDLTIHREEAAKERYYKLYGIEDITDRKHYDFVIDTGVTDIDESVATIIGHLSYDREMRK